MTVISGKFQATELDGYVITYSAEITDEYVLTSVVTLTVVPDEVQTIVLPEVTETYKAGDSIAIPEAKATDVYEGELGTASVKSLSYVESADGKEIDLDETIKSYTPEYSGKLTIVYGYEGLEDKTLVIDVDVNRSGNNAVASGKDALLDLAQKSDKTKLVWDEEGGYIVYAAKVDGTDTGYANIDFNSVARQNVDKLKGEYEYLHFRVNPRRTKENQNRAKVIFFNSGEINDYLYDEPATNGANPRRCAWNEWTDIYIPVSLINTNAGMVITAEFNKASNNYDGMTEMWLTGFDFVKDAKFEAEIGQGEPKDGSAEVTLTVGTAREDGNVAAHMVRVYDAEGKEVTDCVEEGNVWKANLPIGKYTYTIASEDAEYITMEGIYGTAHIGGEFVVNDVNTIVLPEAEEGKAGTEVAIPEAKVVDFSGAEKGVAAIKEIRYTETDGTEYILENTITEYLPKYAGTLSVVYEYEGAIGVTLEIAVHPNRDGRVFGEGKDALNDVTYSNASAKLEYDEENGYYVFKPADPESTATFWTDIFVSDEVRSHVDAVKGEYDYLHFRINCRQTDNLGHPEWLARVRLFQGKTNEYLYGTDHGTYEDIDRFSFNEWCDIYVPVSLVDFGNSAGQLLSAQFFRNNSGADYCNMTEMWIDGLDFVRISDLKETKLTVTADTADGTTTLAVANGMPEGQMTGYTLHVYKGTNVKEEVTGTLENNVWTAADLAPGTYTYKIKVTDPEYVFIGEGKVTEYITGTFTVPENAAPGV